MAFVDNLAFEMVTLVLAAATIAYTAFMGLVEYRRRGPEGLRSSLRGSVAPVGFVGGFALALGFWGDLAWPLPGAYNILFGDVYVLFGIVLMGFAVSVLLGTKLQYLGILSLVAGVAVIEYGYQGYLLGLTKEPLQMFGLYGAFGLAAVLAFPATLVADRMLTGTPWSSGAARNAAATAVRAGGRFGQRASQPIVPDPAPAAAVPSATPEPVGAPFRIPPYATGLVLAFFVLSVAAAIAAMMFVGNTVPSHLASPP
jgi:putative membrane protein